jgi:hypothetical protein
MMQGSKGEVTQQGDTGVKEMTVSWADACMHGR